jgi:hypothetical protein
MVKLILPVNGLCGKGIFIHGRRLFYGCFCCLFMVLQDMFMRPLALPNGLERLGGALVQPLPVASLTRKDTHR